MSEAPTAVAAIHPREAFGPFIVLVVEDQREIRELLLQILETRGHAVRTAASGDEGLIRVAEEGVDLLVTDLAMPGRSGLELAQAAKARFPRIRVLLVTGYAELLDDSARRWVDAVLRKPFTPEQFLQAVEKAFERPPQFRQKNNAFTPLTDGGEFL
jgi:CheY-like chemotaxis protein